MNKPLSDHVIVKMTRKASQIHLLSDVGEHGAVDEGSAEVIAVGSEVKDLKPGHKVTIKASVTPLCLVEDKEEFISLLFKENHIAFIRNWEEVDGN